MSETQIRSFNLLFPSCGTTASHHLPKEAVVFLPKPYIFRSHNSSGDFSQIGPDQCLEQRVRFPDFNVLLDHTLAAVWMCHEQDSTNADINLSEEQLQWAIKFLYSVRSSDDEEFSDVSAIIERMQQVAFEKHALNKKQPKTCQSMPIIEHIGHRRREILSFHEVMGKLCTDKLRDIVQLLGVGDGSQTSSDV